jgi:phage tail sheath protein FI
MSETVLRSAGTNLRELDLSGPQNVGPVGIPAGIIGTSQKGPAFVPITVASPSDYMAVFGQPTNDHLNGPLGALEWLTNSQAATYLRVLGVGSGSARTAAGKVDGAGFVVGSRLPNTTGALADNPYAVVGGVPGRVHFLGALMSESAGATVFSSAGLQPTAIATPILRGVLMAASGVVPMLSSSYGPTGFSSAPSLTAAATFSSFSGSISGTVGLTGGLQEFVLLLNGHKGTLAQYPNVVTASFDSTAPNYFGTILNRDPFKLQEAGYVLYSSYDVNPSLAVVTGTGLLNDNYSAGDSTNTIAPGYEASAFLTYGAGTRNAGTTTVPNFESFEDRFACGFTPWVISQAFGGSPVNLFQIELLDDGEEPTAKVKFSIENITRSTSQQYRYGTFDLLVRRFDDNDGNKVALEQFRGLSLDQNSPRYIAKVIGDKKVFFNFDVINSSQRLVEDGEYSGSSNYIRVNMSEDVKNNNVNVEALPVGFRGFGHLVTSGTAPLQNVVGVSYSPTDLLKRVNQPPVPMRLTITRGALPNQSIDRSLYWGTQFEQQTSPTDSNSSLAPEKTIKEFTKFFPYFQDTVMNFMVGENEGTPSTPANGILDADRFCNNLFSLEKVQVVTGSSTYADSTKAASWSYIRQGGIVANNTNKTRAFRVTDLDDPAVKTICKFSFFAQGGFDGTTIFDRSAKYLTNKSVVEELNTANASRGLTNGPTVKAYSKALDIMKNTTEVNIKVLATPGIRSSYITDQAVRTVETDRFDSIYIMDVEEYDTAGSLVTGSTQNVSVANTGDHFRNRGLDTSYAAAYFPDINMRHPVNNSVVRVPPSVALLGAISRSDSLSHEWFATAGYDRGQVVRAESAVVSLSQNNMDALQDANINPIVCFPGSGGLVVWGQKTLQATASSLDRLNVRRLMLEIRRRIKLVSNKIVFEPNRESTLQKFQKLVDPILKVVQEQQGLDRFKVKIDASTTTEADIENNTIRGKIWLKPTSTLEIVSIDFAVTNNGNFSISG